MGWRIAGNAPAHLLQMDSDFVRRLALEQDAHSQSDVGGGFEVN